ncbi:MAG TPA: type VI secretion system baseplate subunit TssE [Caulobacteraceae bacterium]|jgi:type VI secretion system protein ImpF|nr:type VI secretion system baseplate subunit TssE [Caulobacteraceae bacterium]
MAGARLNPTLFDKLVADLEMEGLKEVVTQPSVMASRSTMRFYTVPRIERFNEAALRSTVMRELNWLLNTTSLESINDLDPYPEVKTSVINYGVRDLAGKTLSQRVVQERGRQMREAIRAFEPRLDPDQLEVENVKASGKPNSITYSIRSDVTSAVQAMPVEYKTDIELDTSSVTLRE